MFGQLAPKLRDMGWRSIIPLFAPGPAVETKRPAIAGWDTFNRSEPTDTTIERWCQEYSTGGVGLAYGPDSVIGVDLDFTDQGEAHKAWDATCATIGDSPLVRIGRAPKRLALYRAAPGTKVSGKAFGGFEIFSHSGQTVLFGMHPQTERPYAWIDESPLTLSPTDLPVITSDGIAALISTLSSFSFSGSRNIRPRTTTDARGAHEDSITSDVMRSLRAASNPICAAYNIVSNAPKGSRHNTTMACILGLAVLGYSDAEIRAALEPLYIALTDPEGRKRAARVFINCLEWSRRRVGVDQKTLIETMQPIITKLFHSWTAAKGRSA